MAAAHARDLAEGLVADSLHLLDREDGEDQVELAVGERKVDRAALDEIDAPKSRGIGLGQRDVIRERRRQRVVLLQCLGSRDAFRRQVEAGEADIRKCTCKRKQVDAVAAADFEHRPRLELG